MTTSPLTAIEKPQVYESKRIRLTSPILHIGSEVSQLNPFEFVEAGNKVYLPDTDLLAMELYKRGKLQDYITAIENRESISYLLKQVLGDHWWEVKLDGKPIFPKHKISYKWTEEKIAQNKSGLRPMIRNGFGQLYIPGTSIKGAIRTAIAYYLLKHAEQYQVPQQQRVSEIEQRLREKIQNRQLQQKPKEVSKSLFMERLFTDFHLIYQDQPVRGKVDSSNTDFMRAIHVTDTKPLRRKKLPDGTIINIPIIAEVIVSSHHQDWKAKYRPPIFAETVYNVRTEFTLTLDTEMLSWFRHNQEMNIPFKNLDELLKICEEFAQEQWDGEHDYWIAVKNNSFRDYKSRQDINLNFDLLRDFYQKEICPYDLRLGWGSGMNGTTIGWLLNDDLRSEIRDVCGISAPNFEAPKSRRSVKNKKGEIRYVPGWGKFEDR